MNRFSKTAMLFIIIRPAPFPLLILMAASYDQLIEKEKGQDQITVGSPRYIGQTKKSAVQPHSRVTLIDSSEQKVQMCRVWEDPPSHLLCLERKVQKLMVRIYMDVSTMASHLVSQSGAWKEKIGILITKGLWQSHGDELLGVGIKSGCFGVTCSKSAGSLDSRRDIKQTSS